MSQEENPSQISADTEKVQEAVNALSNNQGSDWKKTLSGALDEERLLCALVVLCIFYIGLTLANAYHENNNKDEDAIVEMCGCRPEHRAFYIGWSIICYLLWFGCHSMVLLHNNRMCLDRLKDLVQYLFCIRKYDPKAVQRTWKVKCCYCITCKTHQQANKYNIASNDPQKENKRKGDSCIDKIKKHYKGIDHYKYHLWTQYYELYVVGITKNTEDFEPKRLDGIIVEVLKENTNQKRKLKRYVSTTSDTARLPDHMESEPIDTNTDEPKIQRTVQTTTTALPPQTTQWKQFCCQVTLYYILGLIRYVAQLAVVPLLMIQIFDTYAYLCFTADNYCSMTAQYKLHLDQTAMTFAFYCSLMISLLSTTMLCWFPYPRKSNLPDTDKNKPIILTFPSDQNQFELHELSPQPRSQSIISTHFNGNLESDQNNS